MGKTLKVAILVGGDAYYDRTFEPWSYDFDSFVPALQAEGMDAFRIAFERLSSWQELLDVDVVLAEAIPEYTETLHPLMQRECSNRPVLVALDVSTHWVMAQSPFEYANCYLEWVRKADITSAWAPQALLYYTPKLEMRIVRPVPKLYAEMLGGYRTEYKKPYVFSPLYMRGNNDPNIHFLAEIAGVFGWEALLTVNEWAVDAETQRAIASVYPKVQQEGLSKAERHAELFAQGMMGVKIWGPQERIGGRASYMMAKVGTPYLSSNAFPHSFLFPNCVVDFYGGLCGVFEKCQWILDHYADVVGLAEERCAVIEQGGPDWVLFIETLRELRG